MMGFVILPISLFLPKLSKTSYQNSSVGEIVSLKSTTHLGKLLTRLEKVSCLIVRKTINIKCGTQIRGHRNIYLVKIGEWIEANHWLDRVENCQKIARKKGFIERNLNAKQKQYLQEQLQRAKGQEPDQLGVTADQVFEQNVIVHDLVKTFEREKNDQNLKHLIKQIIDQKLVIQNLKFFEDGEVKERLVKKVWSKLAGLFLAIGAERHNLASLYHLYLYRLWEEDQKIYDALQALYDGMCQEGRHKVKNPWAYFLYNLNALVGKAPKNLSKEDLITKFKKIAVLPSNNKQDCLQEKSLKQVKASVVMREQQKELEQKKKEPKQLMLGRKFWSEITGDSLYGSLLEGYTEFVEAVDDHVHFYFNNTHTIDYMLSQKEKVLKTLQSYFPSMDLEQKHLYFNLNNHGLFSVYFYLIL